MSDATFYLPPRPRQSHKGDYGRVLLIAGSQSCSGAALLATAACLRSGAGLVTLAAPGSVLSRIAAANPAAMSLALPETRRGQIAWSAREVLADRLAGFQAVAVGPGLGQSAGLLALVVWLFRVCPCPLVVDADALNALAIALAQGRVGLDDPRDLGGRHVRAGLAQRAGFAHGARPDRLGECFTQGPASVRRGVRVLTPHPGEFARLWSGRQTWWAKQAGRAGADPLGETVLLSLGAVGTLTAVERQAVQLAAELEAVLVLKGAGTLVTDGRRVARNGTGNPGMATGGSGDCLTGILAADLAQGGEPLTVARRSCDVHGRAGDLAADVSGQVALNASDLVDHLPNAWRSWEKSDE